MRQDDRHIAVIPIEPRPRNKRTKRGDVVSKPTPESNAAIAIDNAGERLNFEEHEGDEDNNGRVGVLVDKDRQSCTEASAELSAIDKALALQKFEERTVPRLENDSEEVVDVGLKRENDILGFQPDANLTESESIARSNETPSPKGSWSGCDADDKQIVEVSKAIATEREKVRQLSC